MPKTRGASSPWLKSGAPAPQGLGGYARVLLARVTDPTARQAAKQAGPLGSIVSSMEPYARGDLTLFVLEFRGGRREVFRASEVELVRCGCGCGGATPLAPRTTTRCGWVRGEPIPYLPYHTKHLRMLVDPNPTGRCQCGCGEATRAATRGWSGQISIGAHYRYVYGHHMRGKHRPPTLTCRKGHPRTGQMRRSRGKEEPLCEECRKGQLQRYAAKRKQRQAQLRRAQDVA